jgi:hypothetical protein
MSYSPTNAYYSAGPNVGIVEFTQEASWGGAGDRVTTNSPPIMGAFFVRVSSSGVYNILTYNSANFQYCELIYSCIRPTGRTFFIRQNILSSYLVGGNDGIQATISYINSNDSGLLNPINPSDLAAYASGGGVMYPTTSGFDTTVKTHLYTQCVAKGIFYLI